jgi:uncharacterized protein
MSRNSHRDLFPDLARAAALCGIAVVNVGLFAYPATKGYTSEALATPFDQAAWFLVAALFLYKSYTLFSFMFGVGFAQQMAAAERDQAGFAGRYTRRLIGLLLLGLANIWLLFYGDILVIYAFFGSLLFLFRNASLTRLVRWGRGLYVLQVVITTLFALSIWTWSAFAPEDLAAELATLEQEAAHSFAAFRSADFGTVAAFRMASWLQDISYVVSLQGFGVIAFFLLGLAAAREGLLSDPAAPFWQRSRRVYLPVGMVLSAFGAWLMVGAENLFDPREMLGLAVITLASPWSTAGYLGLIAHWAQRPDSAMRRFMARAGSASLTAYLLQGLLLSLVFCGYGVGLYGSASAAACVLIAALAAFASLAFCSLWRARFARGPVESLLRRWTYLGDAARG